MDAALAKRSAPVIINLATMAVCLLGSAGRVNWPNGWVVIGLSFLTSVASEIVVARNPAMATERRNLRAGETGDRAMVVFVVLLGPAATWVTGGLDARFGWSDGLPAWASAAGIVTAIAGGALLVWAIQANVYFSPVVRIQEDRGQVVVTGGPYRIIRHPGYAGMSAFMVATPLILQSWWALLPAVTTVAVTLVRTALEDRVLQKKLAGYANYALTVRYRLLPFVW